MRMSTYMIIGVRAAPGTKPTEQEPIIGKWYAGADVREDGEIEFGALARYEGDGCFADELDDGWQEVEMRGYDYLQEQF